MQGLWFSGYCYFEHTRPVSGPAPPNLNDTGRATVRLSVPRWLGAEHVPDPIDPPKWIKQTVEYDRQTGADSVGYPESLCQCRNSLN